MIITYHGKQFFRISKGDLTIALNPISKQSKTKSSSFGANLSFITTQHPDYNGVENATHGDTIPFVIDGPGEYEWQGILIKGLGLTTMIEKKKIMTTIYLFSVDGISICFLGPLVSGDLPSNILESIESPDICFVPVGGDLLSPAEAYRLAVSLDAKVVIPMDYDEKSLGAFLKEAGAEDAQKTQKATLKKKDIELMEGNVLILAQ